MSIKSRRLFAILVITAMVLAMLPVSAFAAVTDVTGSSPGSNPNVPLGARNIVAAQYNITASAIDTLNKITVTNTGSAEDSVVSSLRIQHSSDAGASWSDVGTMTYSTTNANWTWSGSRTVVNSDQIRILANISASALPANIGEKVIINLPAEGMEFAGGSKLPAAAAAIDGDIITLAPAAYSASATLLEVDNNKTTARVGQDIAFTLTMRTAYGEVIKSTDVKPIALDAEMDTIYGAFSGANSGITIQPGDLSYRDSANNKAGTMFSILGGDVLRTDSNGQIKFTLTSEMTGSTTVKVYTTDETDTRLLVGSAAVTYTAGSANRSSLNVDKNDLIVNNEIELTASVLTTGGNPVAGVTVTFQERKGATGTWTTIGTKETSAVGNAKLKYTRTGSGEYHYRITVPNVTQGNIEYPDTVNGVGVAIVSWKPGSPVKMTGIADLVGAVDKSQHIDFYLEDVFGNKAFANAENETQEIEVKVTAPSASALTDTEATSPAFGTENFGRYRIENWTPDVEGTYTLRAYVEGTGISFTSKVVVGQFGSVDKIDIIGPDGVNSLRSAAKTGGDPDATFVNLMVRVYDSAGARYTIVSGNNADSDIAISSSHPQYATVTQGGQVKIVADQAANRGKTTITAVHTPTGKTATYDFYVAGAPAAIQEDVTVNGLTAAVSLTMVDADGNVARRLSENGQEYVETPYTVHVNGAAVSEKTNFSKYTSKGTFTLTGEDYTTVTVTVVAENGLAKTFDVTFGAPKPEAVGAKSLAMFIGSKSYFVDGVPTTADAAPFIQDGRTFVPVRLIAEAFGAEADWTPKDAAVEVVTLTRDDIQITINIGSYVINVVRDGVTETVTSDVAAFIKDGRTFLPFRVIAEAFGAEVDWTPKDGPVECVTFTQ